MFESTAVKSAAAARQCCVLELSPLPIACIDHNGIVHYVNDAWVRALVAGAANTWVGQHLGAMLPNSIDVESMISTTMSIGQAVSMCTLPHDSCEQRLFEVRFDKLPCKAYEVHLFAVHFLERSQQTDDSARLEPSSPSPDPRIHEVIHRTKNAFSVVHGILSFQANQQTEPAVAEALRDAVRRVRVFGSLFERLNLQPTARDVELVSYISDLLDDLLPVVWGGEHRIVCQVSGESLLVPARVAASLGVVINELVTNSTQHGFHACASPGISVKFVRDAGRASLHYADNGVGLDSDITRSASSIGMELIEVFTRDIDGELTYGHGPGFECTVAFPVDHPLSTEQQCS